MKHVPVSMRVFSIVILLSMILPFSPGGAIPTTASQPTAPPSQANTISQEVLSQLGISHPAGADMTQLSQQVAQEVQRSGMLANGASPAAPASGGLPSNLSPSSAFSAAVITSLSGGGRFNEVDMMGDLDGKEDLTADHSAKVNDFGAMPAGWSLTRTAISEHTVANGFNENIFYYGDSFGNVYVAASQPGVSFTSPITTTVLNLPTILNAFGTLNSDDQVVVTGLAVNPVADLTSFARVNGSFATFNGEVGEILMVSYWDTGGGLRLFGNGQLIHSGVLAFPIADVISPAKAPPGIQSAAGFPVTVGGSFGVAFSAFSNLAGLAVDDDGSIYFQQVDLINFQGGNIVKITSVDQPTGSNALQDRSPATNGFLTTNNLNPPNGNYGISSGPSNQSNRFTNYSGTSPTFGNITALATGPNNVLYAALARSYVPDDPADVRNTEGLFQNPNSLGPTPSMIISFSDTSGSTDMCSAPPGAYTIINPGPITVTVPFTGSLPIADGLADVAQNGLPAEPGVDNFRVFALGSGPDIRSETSSIGATPENTLQLDFQVDYTVYAGLAVDEENKVYVVSGGTPAGIGRDPSPNLGEVLLFPDSRPFDRRADFIDLRGDTPPNPPESGTAPGDGVSDRYDHIFWQAPLDPVAATPAGISGLGHGFLLYLNRIRNNGAAFPALPNGITQGDNSSSGLLYFDSFDAGHQVAGGDDQYSPFTGDDSDSGGSNPIAGPLNGGFEFVCAGGGLECSQPLNAFYLNSNGSLTITSGDTNANPTTGNFLTGSAKIAPAWADLNTASHTMAYTNTFPVQALGFAGINDFKVRWINVPERNKEKCGSQNTFAVSLFDDGTGVDENASQPLNPANPIGNNTVPFDRKEGPTAMDYYKDPNTGVPVGVPPRQDGSGYFRFDYGRMDLLGTPDSPVLVGYSAGGLAPGILISNLSEEARAREAAVPNDPALMVGAPPARFEFFNTGVPPTITVSGGITMPVSAVPAYDLRGEGNDAVLSTPPNQPNLNRGRVDLVNLQPPEIAQQKSASPTTVEVGLPYTYTLTLIDPGVPASNVTVSETLPVSTTLVGISPPGTQTASGISWTGLNLPNFGFLDFDWTVIPDCDTAGKTLVDSSVVTATQNTVPGAPVSAPVNAVKQGALAAFSYANPGGGSTFDFSNHSLRASSYLWDFGDGAKSTEPNPSHIFGSGTFKVKLTASNTCTSDTTARSLTVSGTTIYLPVVIKLP